MGIGEVGVGKVQLAGGRVVRNQRSAGRAGAPRKRDGFRPGGDDRNVVGAGDRDRERHRRLQIERRVIAVDQRGIGQRQLLAGGKEVESVVGDEVGPGRRTDVCVAGVLHDDQVNFGRLDIRQLQRIQRRFDVFAVRVLVGERRERRADGRSVADVDIVEVDFVERQVERGAAGDFGDLGDEIAEDCGDRRLIDVLQPVRTSSRTRRRVTLRVGDLKYRCSCGAAGRLDKLAGDQVRIDRIGEVRLRLGI